MSILSKVKIICQQLRGNIASSYFLQDFSQCIILLSQSKDIHAQNQIIGQITSFLSFLSEKSVFKTNISLKSFITEKILIIVEIILVSSINNHETAPLQVSNNIQQFSILVNLISDDSNNIIVKHVCDKIQSGLIIPWKDLYNGNVIEALCQQLKNRKINSQNIRSFIHFVTTLPSFQQIQVSTVQTAEGQMNPKQKSLKDNYQKLLLQVLSEAQQSDYTLKINIYRSLGQQVFSKLLNPLILSQFFLKKFKQHPGVQIEVLSSLFILVGKYGLELEGFFEKLEDLIQRKHQGKSVYQLPNSRRFFKLVESSLRSSKVPFSVILKMSKIILRQVFEQESEFSFWALAFVVNLTKKHRQLLNHFQNLPQIILLRKHYSSKVRSLLSELDKNLNKAEYLDISQFSGIKTSKIFKMKLEKFKEKLESDQTLYFKVPIYETL